VSGIWKSVEHRGRQVDHYYATFLGRPAEPAGRAFHVQRFLNGAGEGDVVLGFVLSEEYRSAHADATSWVQALYRDALSRDAEAAGLACWTGQLQSRARSERQVAHEIVNSDESFLRAVDGYYAAFLHRPGEQAGREVWLELLRHGRAAEGPVGAGTALPSRPGLLGVVGEQFLSGNQLAAEYFARGVATVPA
jgi:Domain of unknown function (DUF4214)